jgi:hypothetical protein
MVNSDAEIADCHVVLNPVWSTGVSAETPAAGRGRPGGAAEAGTGAAEAVGLLTPADLRS